VGVRTGFVLAKQFGSLEKLAAAKLEDLETIREIGPITAESIVHFFSQPTTKTVIQKLVKAGVETALVEKEAGENPCKGKTFVLTGTISMSRPQAETLLRKLGAHPSGSVSKKTDFVIVGESAGSKAGKAKKLGIKTLDDKAFLKLLKDSGLSASELK